MEFYAINYSTHPQSQFSINPPNRVITVFHCEIITRLLLRCQTPNRLHQFTKTCRRLTSTGSEIMPLSDLELPELLEFIDIHFHLDVLIRRLKTMCKELNFNDVEGMLGPFHQHHLLFGIANYAYPSSWQYWREQVNGNSRIKLTWHSSPYDSIWCFIYNVEKSTSINTRTNMCGCW